MPETALIFDLDDTLYDRKVPFVKACQGALRVSDTTDFTWLYHRYLAHGNAVFDAAMEGKMTMRDMHIYRISETIKELNREITQEEALEYQRQFEWNQGHIELDERILPFLRWGKENNALMAIITNGETDHQRDKYHALRLEKWIDKEHFLASGDVNINKPDTGIFKIAEERWNLDPDTTWYIGDSYQHDIIGAHAAGWHTIWLDKKGEKDQIENLIADRVFSLDR